MNKKLQVSMLKVKAHSGEYFNEKADQIAKSIDDYLIVLNLSQSTVMQYIPTWMNIPIDNSPRQFMKTILEAKQIAEFLNLDRNKNIDLSK